MNVILKVNGDERYMFSIVRRRRSDPYRINTSDVG